MASEKQVLATADTLANALKMPTQALGLDLDGVIDENAEFFGVVSKSWPGKVYVITYRSDRDKAVADLARFGIRYTDVILVNSFSEKADVIAKFGINVYIDDQDEILMHIPESVTVLKVRNGGNYDFDERKWLYSDKTGQPV